MFRRTPAVILLAMLLPCAGRCEYFGLRGGVIDPEGFDMTFTYGGFIGQRVTRHLELEAGVDYWSKTEEGGYDLYYHWESSASDLSVCAYTKYPVSFGSDELTLGFGAGFGAHFIKTRQLYLDHGQVTSDEKENATRPGMHFFLDAGAPLSSEFQISTRFGMGFVPREFRVYLTTGLAFKV